MKKIYSTKKYSAGYTLIEILVASLIFVSVLAIAITSFSSSSAIQMKNKTIRENSQAGRYITESVSRDMRLAVDKPLPPSVSSDGKILTLFIREQDNTISKITYEYIAPISDTNGQITTAGRLNYSKKIRCVSATLCTDDYNTTNVNIVPTQMSISTVGNRNIFTANVYSPPPPMIYSQIQPTLRISFSIEGFPGTNESEKSRQIFQTSVATRSYSDFNMP